MNTGIQNPRTSVRGAVNVGALVIGLWAMFSQTPEEVSRYEEDVDNDDYNVARPFNDTDNG